CSAAAISAWSPNKTRGGLLRSVEVHAMQQYCSPRSGLCSNLTSSESDGCQLSRITSAQRLSSRPLKAWIIEVSKKKNTSNHVYSPPCGVRRQPKAKQTSPTFPR